MADKDEQNASERDKRETTQTPSDSSEEVGERDESTKGVAKALGVDEDEPADAEATGAAEGGDSPNRAARRREAVLKRRAKRQKGSSDEEEGTSEEEADALPKDRNARAKELLRRRQLAASGANTTQIGTSEMVEASMVKATSAATKWLKANLKVVLAATLGCLIAYGAYAFFMERKAKAMGLTSDNLVGAIEASQGAILKEDKRSEDEKRFNPVPVFPAIEARTDAALASYNQLLSTQPDTGLATLAKLGLAGAHLEKGENDRALELFSSVSSSELAMADIDVKARAMEGLGFAKEAKKDLDGALQTYKELEKLQGFEDLARYHSARIAFQKGDKAGAKTAFMELRKKLEVPSVSNGTAAQDKQLLKRVEDYIRTIDPEALPKKLDLGGGGRMTPEQLEAMQEQIRKLQEEMKNKAGHEEESHEGGE